MSAHMSNSTSTQDVIASIGGVQALIPVFWSMVALGGGAHDLSILANLVLLLTAFIHDHDKNAKELLY
jgi:hypothetical protein